jgi:hypothetical protein
MRPLHSLSLEAIIEMLAQRFGNLPDERDAARVDYAVSDVVMSAFAMMFFQHSSLLQFQAALEEKHGLSNLQTIFGVEQIPKDSQMRDILDAVDPECLRPLLSEVFEKMRRAGWLGEFKTTLSSGTNAGDYFVIAFDGSEYFRSTRIQCPGCLHCVDKSGQTQFYHSVVSATIVRAGSHKILPLDVEEVRNTDGEEKQDCEINAAKRLVERIRQQHPQIKAIVVGDDLYSHEPIVLLLLSKRLNYVLAAKPESHKEMFQWVEELEKCGGVERGAYTEGAASQRRYFEYRIVRQVPLNGGLKTYSNFVEVWVRDSKGKLLYHNSWITNLDVNKENVAEIVQIGRSRWKIENEQFNVQKNHGYELEHNYGHGKKNLSMVFYLLNLLAFLTHIILEIGDRLYQVCRGRYSRKEMWNGLRNFMNKVLVWGWKELLQSYAYGVAASP